jgi:predicted lactoylglutathione lyase
MVASEEEFLAYMKVIREEFDFICQVKSAVANEEWEVLRCIVEETPNEVKEALNLAQSKGGVFTTYENQVMKINPLRRCYER